MDDNQIIELYIVTDIPSVENDLLRLQVESAVTDGPAVMVFYSIERLDGGSMEGWTPIMDIRTLTEGNVQKMVRSGGLPDEPGETDSKIYGTFISLSNFYTDRVEMNLSGLTNYGTMETLSCPALELFFPLEPCGCKVGVRGDDPDGEWLNSDILLSPLSLSFHIYRNLNGLSGDGDLRSAGITTQLHSTVALIHADGTVEDITQNCIHSHHSSVFDTVHCVFEELRDVSDITAVRIDGYDHPLKYGQRPEMRSYSMDDTPSDYNSYLLGILFGEHSYAEPKRSAEADGNGLELKGIWTDGQDAELILRVESASENYANIVTADYGGYLNVNATDKDGNPLAVSAEANPFRGHDNGAPLIGVNVHVGGTAKALTISLHEATLEIPLDMKKLEKLPQGEHLEIAATETAKSAGYELFLDRFPGQQPRTDLTGENSAMLIAIEYALAKAGNGSGRLELLGYAKGLDGKRPPARDLTGIRLEILEDGAWHIVSGSSGGSDMTSMQEEDRRMIHYDYRFDGDFVSPEALRVTWRPGHGDPISIEIPLNG